MWGFVSRDVMHEEQESGTPSYSKMKNEGINAVVGKIPSSVFLHEKPKLGTRTRMGKSESAFCLVRPEKQVHCLVEALAFIPDERDCVDRF